MWLALIGSSIAFIVIIIALSIKVGMDYNNNEYKYISDDTMNVMY
jgi:uncharacterized membrane protein YgaE (UPF0421/DUF939 family)